MTRTRKSMLKPDERSYVDELLTPVKRVFVEEVGTISPIEFNYIAEYMALYSAKLLGYDVGDEQLPETMVKAFDGSVEYVVKKYRLNKE